MSIVEMSKNDFAFWTDFYDGDDCFEWASKKAYLDMNRTMTFKEVASKDKKNEKDIENQRKAWRDKGTKIFRERFSKMSGSFDVWHEETCKAIIDIYGDDKLVAKIGNKRTQTPVKLTFGQAQKWLNMTLKYLWLLYRLGMLENKYSDIVFKYEKDFHVPLDSYILRYVAKVKKRKKEFPDNELGNADFSKYWELFSAEWSKIREDNREDYYKYQAKIRNAIAKDKYPTALSWELVHWHKALVYYD